MKKVQDKLKECIGKGAMNSLEKLSSQLGTTAHQQQAMMDEDERSVPDIDASETVATIDVSKVKGENKVPVSKRSKRRKHKLTAAAKEKKAAETTKPRPRFFCQF